MQEAAGNDLITTQQRLFARASLVLEEGKEEEAVEAETSRTPAAAGGGSGRTQEQQRVLYKKWPELNEGTSELN